MQKGSVQFIILGIAILILVGAGGFYLGRQSLPKLVPSQNQVANPQASPSPTAVADETANWKTYTDQYMTGISITDITFKYPQDWTYIKEYAHGTADLGVTFQDKTKKDVVMFTFSIMDFLNDFYKSQQQYLGSLHNVTIAGKTGYEFENKYNYLKAYYFPLENGYFSLRLLDANGSSILDKIIPSISISTSTIR